MVILNLRKVALLFHACYLQIPTTFFRFQGYPDKWTFEMIKSELNLRLRASEHSPTIDSPKCHFLHDLIGLLLPRSSDCYSSNKACDIRIIVH